MSPSHLFRMPVDTIHFCVGISAGATQKEGQSSSFCFIFFRFCFSTPPIFLLRRLPFFFIARRVRRSLSFVNGEVSFFVPTTWSLSTVGRDVRRPRQCGLHRDLKAHSDCHKVPRIPNEPPGYRQCVIACAFFAQGLFHLRSCCRGRPFLQ